MIYVVGICLGAKLLSKRLHRATEILNNDNKIINVSKSPSDDSVIAKVVHGSI